MTYRIAVALQNGTTTIQGLPCSDGTFAFGHNGDAFPIIYAGNRYSAVASRNITTSQTTLRVLKSTDNGATWTELDGANSPAGGEPRQICASYFRGGTSVIVGGSLDGSSKMRFKTIDLSAGTPAWSAFTASTADQPDDCLVAQRVNGDLLCVYVKNSSGNVLFTVYSSGAWSAPVTLSTTTSGGLASMYFDPVSGTATVLFYDGVANTAYAIAISSSNSVGSAIAVTDSDLTNASSSGTVSHGVGFGGKAYFGYQTSGLAARKLAQTDSLSAPTTLTYITVDSSATGEGGYQVYLNAAGTTLCATWEVDVAKVITITDGAEHVLITTSTSTNGSTWGSPATYLDSRQISGWEFANEIRFSMMTATDLGSGETGMNIWDNADVMYSIFTVPAASTSKANSAY